MTKPPQVVVKKSRRLAVTSHVGPPATPKRPPLTDAEEATVAKFYYRQRIYKANNPDVLDEICERLANVDRIEENLASIIPIRHPTFGPIHAFVPKRGAEETLGALYRR